VGASTPERILQRIDWQVIRRLDGILQGDYRTLFYGQGVDFADLREYQVGDDIRYMDWNVTARTAVPHVRQYSEDREITAWFLLDLSPSLDYGPTNAKKKGVLLDFVATLARLLTRHGNRVGAMLSVASVEHVFPARGGRLHVLRILHELMKASETRTNSITDLGVLLDAGLKMIKRRSLVVVVSDFISSPGWEAKLGMLNRRHEAIAVCVQDPSEQLMPDVGAVIMEDSETGEQVYVDTHDPGFRLGFEQAIEKHRADLTGAFRRAGVDSLWLSTNEDLLTAFVRFAALRERHRRAA
jgi:uncharacterized protein (DUF58 family)